MRVRVRIYKKIGQDRIEFETRKTKRKKKEETCRKGKRMDKEIDYRGMMPSLSSSHQEK